MQMKDMDNLNPSLKGNIKNSRDPFNLYLHHLAQLDKLLSVISLLKKENKQLRHLLHINKMEKPSTLDLTKIKPKITCWNTK